MAFAVRKPLHTTLEGILCTYFYGIFLQLDGHEIGRLNTGYVCVVSQPFGGNPVSGKKRRGLAWLQEFGMVGCIMIYGNAWTNNRPFGILLQNQSLRVRLYLLFIA